MLFNELLEFIEGLNVHMCFRDKEYTYDLKHSNFFRVKEAYIDYKNYFANIILSEEGFIDYLFNYFTMSEIYTIRNLDPDIDLLFYEYNDYIGDKWGK